MNSETQLSSLPGYQHYVIGHNVTKEQNGFRLDSTYYKKYYSTIDAEVYFGDEYGISIDSELDVGTTVTIRIPKIEKGRENEY